MFENVFIHERFFSVVAHLGSRPNARFEIFWDWGDEHRKLRDLQGPSCPHVDAGDRDFRPPADVWMQRDPSGFREAW